MGPDGYRRTIVLDGDPGMLELLPGGTDHLLLRAHLPHWEGLIHVVEQAGRMAGLDTDMAEAERRLGLDPLLGPRIHARPGLRVPGTWSSFEVGVHAIVTQELELDAARARLGELVRRTASPCPGSGTGSRTRSPRPPPWPRPTWTCWACPQPPPGRCARSRGRSTTVRSRSTAASRSSSSSGR